MAEGMFTSETRWRFVQKTPGEVGDGTKYPIRALPDQIAEATYRVRDAWFTAGDLFWDFGGSTGNISVIGSLSVGNPFVAVDDGNYRERSYGVQWESTWPFADYFFQTGYASGMPFSPTRDTAFDIGLKERALYQNDEDGLIGINKPDSAILDLVAAPYASDSGYQAVTFRCAFHHLHECDPTPGNPYGIYSYPDSDPSAAENTLSSLLFSGEIAWVDVNGSGNPLDPLNELYLGVRFRIFTSSLGQVDTIQESGYSLAGCNLVLQLSGSTITCSLYVNDIVPTSSDNFVIAAKEWLPYAKGNPSVPVWDTENGAPL